MKVALQTARSTRGTSCLRDLVEIQYEPTTTTSLARHVSREGDTIEIFPAYEEERAIRVGALRGHGGDIKEIDPLRGKVLGQIEKMSIFPRATT